MSDFVDIRSTGQTFDPGAVDSLVATCRRPYQALLRLQEQHSCDVGTGWVLCPPDKKSGVANLRAMWRDDCALLFGGVTGSSWYPDEGCWLYATLVRGSFSVRVRGRVDPASEELSNKQWASRPLAHRTAYYAVRAAQGTPTSPRMIADALNSGFVNGTLKPDSVATRPSDWKCFWITPIEVRFTFLGEHRIHRCLDFRKTNLTDEFTISRNA